MKKLSRRRAALFDARTWHGGGGKSWTRECCKLNKIVKQTWVCSYRCLVDGHLGVERQRGGRQDVE